MGNGEHTAIRTYSHAARRAISEDAEHYGSFVLVWAAVSGPAAEQTIIDRTKPVTTVITGHEERNKKVNFGF